MQNIGAESRSFGAGLAQAGGVALDVADDRRYLRERDDETVRAFGHHR